METCSYGTLCKLGNGAFAGWYNLMGQHSILASGRGLLYTTL